MSATSSHAPVALELARRINAVKYEDLPDAAIHWARVGILDLVGCTIAGSDYEGTRILTEVLDPKPGPALIFGSARRVGTLDAAMINGIASHALDFDDCNNTFGGHPSAPLLPGLFALADELGSDGREFITAYVAGFEAGCKISMGVNMYQYTRGWHPTGTLGVFCAAAACARLLKLTDEQTAVAMAVAASFSSGIKSNFGTMTKPLHPGQSTRNGLLAALLAKKGFTANHESFEHKQGYFEVFNGKGNYDIDAIFATWGQPWDIVEPGIAIKSYPCCGSTHPAVDIMLQLASEHDLKPEQVQRIDSWTHARRLEHTNRPDPRSETDAKFSVQYCLLRALADRKITIEQFEGDAWKDVRIRNMLSRVHAAPYTTAQFPEDMHFGAEVKVTLKDGRVLSGKVNECFGRTSDNPLPADILKSKFMGCVSRILPEAQGEELHAAIDAFEKIKDVREFTGLMAKRPRGVQRPAVGLERVNA